MSDDKWSGMGWQGDVNEGKAHFVRKYGAQPAKVKLIVAPDTWIIGPIPEDQNDAS